MNFQDVLGALPRIKNCIEDMREILLANLVLVGEIPAPTFGESQRIRFLQDRFVECGLHNISRDEVGNGLGILPGEDGGDSIMLVAHADTKFSANDDHGISVQSHKVTGAGVADNSLGLAFLATLPTLLDRLDIRLQSDLLLMAESRSLGRGNLEGIRFFLDHNVVPVKAGLCIEGVPLGRISIASMGMLRAEISCHVPEQYDWTRFGASGAIMTLNEVINRITAIALPRKPRTTIVLGSVQGGASFNAVATQALLRFEIRSDSAEMVSKINERIEEIVDEISSETESEVVLDVIARRVPGGLPFAHPLSRRARQIMKALDVVPRIIPSTSELAAFIDKDIPALTLGLTEGENLDKANETIMIDPLARGVAQLVGVLLAIDGGFCDERE